MTGNSLNSRSDYLPGREALLVRIDMSRYLIDYYLHRRDVSPQTDPERDEKLKELIVCFAMHLAARPPGENHAWTVHLVAEQPYSLFVTGSTGPLDSAGRGRGFIVGNVLTENIRHTDVNSLHAQFSGKDGMVYRSYVQPETDEIPRMMEYFYEQSEQNRIRVHYSKTSDESLAIVALPDWDESWFFSVELEGLKEYTGGKQMRNVEFDFRCDCSPDKLLPFFRSLSDDSINDLYGTDKELVISCPRCGKQFIIDRLQVHRPE